MGWEVKNLLSCQSKHGLVGSSAKTRKFLTGESQERKRSFKIYNVVQRLAFRSDILENGKI